MRRIALLLAVAAGLAACQKDDGTLHAQPVAYERIATPVERPVRTYTRVQDAHGMPVRHPVVPAGRPARH